MRLRRLQEKDAPGMLEWMQDKDIQKCFRFSTQEKTLNDVLRFIEVSDVLWEHKADVHYAAVDDNDE